uniref:Structural protein n=1 Tax=Caenorhabditis tropicalis TaxID=1561998 RepID=A0A1I7T4G7_9PELO
MNPADRWNPGWQQFMMNHQRAQAGGNRHVQPVQPVINQFGGGARNVVEFKIFPMNSLITLGSWPKKWMNWMTSCIA